MGKKIEYSPHSSMQDLEQLTKITSYSWRKGKIFYFLTVRVRLAGPSNKAIRAARFVVFEHYKLRTTNCKITNTRVRTIKGKKFFYCKFYLFSDLKEKFTEALKLLKAERVAKIPRKK